MPGNNREVAPKPLSQTQGFGMVPVYQETRGGRGPLLGYQFDESVAARQGIVETPKPPAILAEEQRLGGKELEPVYAETTVSRGRGGASETIKYGPPIGYRYDNGKSEYVNFTPSGEYEGTVKRQSGIDPALLAVLAMPFIGPAAFEALGLTGAGAGAAGAAAAPLAFTPEMIAAGLTPGSIGAAGAASGALTGANLAAAGGIGSLGAGALTGAAGTAALPASEVASLGSGAAPSLNQLAASGMGPGSYGALNLPALEAAVAAGSIAPEALAAAQLAATGTTGAGIASLAPTLAKSVNEGIASGTFTPGSVGADLASKGLLTAEQLAAAAGVTTAGATPALVELGRAGKGLPSANEMIASGTGAGSAGAAGAASGVLTPAELAAASGVVTEGATPALFELGRAGKGLTSANEAVASGLGPGSAGAKAAVEGTLTAQELAAAAGTAGALNKDGITDLLGKAKDALTDKAKDASSKTSSGSGIGTLGALALLSMMNKGGGGTPASTATIPELTATRTQLPYDVDKKGVNPNTPYRPGQGGVTYFSPTTYTPTPKAAGGGLMSLGQSNLGGYSDGGRLLKGPGDGVSDSIPAIIGKKQPARLANGEFVIPARIVSELGNGSTDAGAKRLYEMMARVQRVRRKTKNVAANTKASKYLPA